MHSVDNKNLLLKYFIKYTTLEAARGLTKDYLPPCTLAYQPHFSVFVSTVASQLEGSVRIPAEAFLCELCLFLCLDEFSQQMSVPSYSHKPCLLG